MNPETNNQNNPSDPANTNQAGETPVGPQLPQQQPMPENNNFADKAWRKIKASAILLIISCIFGLVLLPVGYNYTLEATELSMSAVIALYAISALLQIFLLFIGVKLLKRTWAFSSLTAFKRRLLFILPLVLSLIFVAQLSKYVNLVAFVLLMLAIMDLRKAGIITKATR